MPPINIEARQQSLASMGFPSGTTITAEFTGYAGFVGGCLRTYDQEVQPKDMIMTALNRVHSRSASDVRSGAESGNPEDILEWGIRLYKGYVGPA
ncbi:hypothetical protein EVJ58_g559 [Rhodofomes roseus]|uniref:Uncharacterized protein n=1 Tax=Rhodofomes roseus TaxID=34475 RepID=A0A4Y9Z582_9APHY|nr:hypothetical protein EVJ58_g559 [Rhodofomes roseus]